jgi:hypothetical protein
MVPRLGGYRATLLATVILGLVISWDPARNTWLADRYLLGYGHSTLISFVKCKW